MDLKSIFWFRLGSENKTMMMFCDIQNLFQFDCHASKFSEVDLKKIQLRVTKHGFCLRNPNISLELYKVPQDHFTKHKSSIWQDFFDLSHLLKTSDCGSFIVLETFIG